AKKRQASHEAERTAAPTGDESCPLAKRPYPEEALGHFEHQFCDCLGFAVSDRARIRASAHLVWWSCRRHACVPLVGASVFY
ncbi:MAG TPA: hypothetical protein VLJ62_22445, partial [Burkholderiaceae bacterium]|nr:hypothetical protein [Burkholderiaceae bacterium]